MLPLFVEITQTTSMTRAWYPSPPLQAGVGAFLYQADTRTLHVHSAYAVSQVATDVLIGMINILEMPGQTFESRELFQYPGAQPDIFQVASLDTATGRMELRYLGKLHVLLPGETLTFKEPGAGPDSPSTVTTIVSHGWLEELRTLTADGAVP